MKRKLTIVIIGIACTIPLGIFVVYPATLKFEKFTMFPVDLDILFRKDNETAYQEMIKSIKECGFPMPISPFSRHFEHIHTEGGGKWYLTPCKHLEVYLPEDGIITSVEVRDGRVGTINGHKVVIDVMIDIYLGDGITLRFDHIDLLKSLKDRIIPHFTYVRKGEFIGFTPCWDPEFEEKSISLDFQLFDESVRNGVSKSGFIHYEHVVCPLNYFSSELRDKIIAYYNETYEALKVYGKRPEGTICSPFNINIPHTLWGTWYYVSGPVEFGRDEIWRYTGGIISIVPRNMTNPETFYKYMNDTPLGPEVDGTIAQVSELKKEGILEIGGWIIEIVEGNESDGILRGLERISGNSFSPTLYVRYHVNIADDPLDETLKIEFFTTLEDARAGFTGNAMVYSRNIDVTIEELITRIVLWIASLVIVGVVAIVLYIVWRRKRTQKLKTRQN